MTGKEKTIDTIAETDLGHSKLVLRSDGILVMYCDEETVYDVAHIKEIIEATGKMTGGKKCAQLTMAGKYSSVSREARDFVATDEAVKYTSCEAYVIQSLAQRILGNFYLKFYTPKVPTRIFTNLEKAEEWLREMRLKKLI